MIAIPAQQVGVGHMSGRHESEQLPAHAQAPDVLPGENGTARGSSGRRGAASMMEEHTFTGDAVERGGANHRIAAGAGMGPGLVVGDADANVGSGGLVAVKDGVRRGITSFMGGDLKKKWPPRATVTGAVRQNDSDSLKFTKLHRWCRK